MIHLDERRVSRVVVRGVVSAILALAFVACGGRLAPIDTTPVVGDGGVPDAVTDDAVADATNDASPDASDGAVASDASDASSQVEASTGCLASPPPAPQVLSSGGPVLATPRVIPVFYRDDPLQKSIESFLGSLEGSGYWASTTGEYGVGALSVADSIVLDADSPAAFGPDDAVAMLQAHLAGATPDWPANASGDVYTIFLQGQMNDGACGYHDETPVAGTNAVFAVVERCDGMYDWTKLDMTTIALSHELVEATTDPYPETAPAYQTVDADHEAWALALGGSELGDLCWNGEAVQAQPLVGTYVAQRTWSNARAAAGHDPCVPQLPGPYLTAVVDPSELAPVTITDPSTGQTIQTKALELGHAQTRKVKLRLWSDAPTTPWNLDIVGDSNVFGQSSAFEVACDQTVTLDLGRSQDSAWDTVEIDSYHQIPYLGWVLVTE